MVRSAETGPRDPAGEPQHHPGEMEEEGKLLVARSGVALILVR
ncbi:hypothetical protein [Capsulimonas corticalis]|nr:hypothetical protein [Capsulimonas corticalis]